MKGVLLENLTWEEAAEAIRQMPMAVLPIGAAAKEHGPHLPLNTDYIWAETLRHALAERTPCLVLPTLGYAYYPAFVEWPGSVSIRPSHFIGVVHDIVASLHRHGMKRFLIINTGVSTTAPLDIVSRELHDELGVLVAVLLLEHLGMGYWQTVAEEKAGTHANERETSFMLHVRPDLVRKDRIVNELQDRGSPAYQTGLGLPRAVIMGRKMTSKTGIHGEPQYASAEKGKGLLEESVKEMVYYAEELARMPVPN